MIIRPVCEREYTSLPNQIFNDRRLSADTRAMIAFALSKSRNWELRPGPLARALSREGEKPLGRTRLDRIFREAMAAGYMARSMKQTHQDDGKWGRYVYFIGLPSDVAAAVEKEGVAILPHARKPQTADPHTVPPHTADPHTDSKKEKNPETTDSKNSSPKALSASGQKAEEAVRDKYTAFGKAALEAGCVPVFENSKPYQTWVEHRGLDGMPPIDVVTSNGAVRRVVWMPSLYPRRASSG
jgi:hypothetical protein